MRLAHRGAPPEAAARCSIFSGSTPATIFRRFFSAAMSIGALSPEAREALAMAMNRLGSPLAASLLGEGAAAATRFRKVQPGARSGAQAGEREPVVTVDRSVEVGDRDVLVGGVRNEN